MQEKIKSLDEANIGKQKFKTIYFFIPNLKNNLQNSK